MKEIICLYRIVTENSVAWVLGTDALASASVWAKLKHHFQEQRSLLPHPTLFPCSLLH